MANLGWIEGLDVRIFCIGLMRLVWLILSYLGNWFLQGFFYVTWSINPLPKLPKK